MASLFVQLFDTLPFAAAACAAMTFGGDPLHIPAWHLSRFVTFLGKRRTFSPPFVDFPDHPTATAKLWNWSSDGSEFKNVSCRVAQQRYRRQVVLQQAVFGHQEGRSMEESVKVGISTRGGPDIDLDLRFEDEFLHSKWYVHDAEMPRGAHWLWPLAASLDSALVIAYAYEIRPDGPAPYTPSPDEEGEQAMHELAGSKDPTWWRRAWKGSFMDGRPALLAGLPDAAFRSSVLAAKVGEKKKGKAEWPRILVVVSFSTFKELNDFDLGAAGGVARFYPHIMVRSSVPLSYVRGAVRMTRPEETTALDLPDLKSSCCNANRKIGSLLITDSNDVGVDLPDMPLWCPLFAYGEADPHLRIHEPIRMVDRRKIVRHPDPLKPSPVKRYDELWHGYVAQLKKQPRQGEFDNVHLSPHLSLDAAWVSWKEFDARENDTVERHLVLKPADRKRLRLDDLVMAPICAHDCFHLHTRWGTLRVFDFNNGWGDTMDSPYQVAGAPMVPPNQDVDLTFLGAANIIYSAMAQGLHPGEPIPALEWQTVCHHGGGYVCRLYEEGITDLLKALSVPYAASFHQELRFFDKHSNEITPQDDMAVFYWVLRYYLAFDMVDGKSVPKALERVDFSDKTGIDIARKY